MHYPKQCMEHREIGVILITTMRGKAGKQKLRIAGQYGAATPRAMPKYLNAADYMDKYNEAQLNDGIDPASLRYKQEAIDGNPQWRESGPLSR